MDMKATTRLDELQAEIERLSTAFSTETASAMRLVGAVGRGVHSLRDGEVSKRVVVTFSLSLPAEQQELSAHELALVDALCQAIDNVLTSPDTRL
jgi:predicted transcriptional regulator